jgi:hypothetical protein
MLIKNRLTEESGEFHFSNISEKKSRTIFAWRGDEDFIQRSNNLVYNFGLIQKSNPYRFDHRTFYVYTDKNAVINFLIRYFHVECLGNKEYTKLQSYAKNIVLLEDPDLPSIIEENYNKEEFDILVNGKVEEFWQSKLKHNELKFNHAPSLGLDIYNISVKYNFKNKVF